MAIRDHVSHLRKEDERMTYRGMQASRLDNVTDAVFGIAITLLIFNLSNPNSFSELLVFTKTLPAFLLSISFIFLIWTEHLRFSRLYTLQDTLMVILNIVFLALVIFYVYPLRFLTLFLTNFFFGTSVSVSIRGDQVPLLMMYYGAIVSALYLILFLFYVRASRLSGRLQLNDFEQFHTRAQCFRMAIMFAVPMISIGTTAALQHTSFILASVMGGVAYFLYTPAMLLWRRYYLKHATYHDSL